MFQSAMRSDGITATDARKRAPGTVIRFRMWAR